MKASVRKAATPRRRTAPRSNERRLVRQHPRRRILSLAAGAAAIPAVSRMAWAQAYPKRPITLVVPFAPGGATDVIGRVMAERLRTVLGQPVIIENIAGANGSIGVGRVARSTPDGYTLVLGIWSTHVTNGVLYTLQYDALKDFEPVALLSKGPFMVVAKNALPANDLKGLIAWLKANPNKALAGHSGVGNGTHLSSVFFQNVTGTRFQHVPYRGSGPAMLDLVSGQIDLMFADTTTALPQVRAGYVKAYAVLAKTRLTAAPRIPTVDEAGLPGLYFSPWYALFAPKGTPKNIIDTLNAAAIDALANPTVRSRFEELTQEIYPRDQQTPEALAALQVLRPMPGRVSVPRWTARWSLDAQSALSVLGP
jgi:tripartite-type tricarboxylate transporter receptor subunit TctC